MRDLAALGLEAIGSLDCEVAGATGNREAFGFFRRAAEASAAEANGARA
jgi:hypothetical protein